MLAEFWDASPSPLFFFLPVKSQWGRGIFSTALDWSLQEWSALCPDGRKLWNRHHDSIKQMYEYIHMYVYIYICTYIHVCTRYHLNLHGYVFAPSKQLESAEDHADALAVMGTLLRPRAIWMPSERISENTATSTLHNWLVVFSHPSEKYESQLGWWNSQYDWENKIDVPNHQPDSVSYCIIMHQVYS